MGGDEGNRTPNPRLAKAVLCQLSYVPLSAGGAGKSAGLAQVDNRCVGVGHCFVPQVLFGTIVSDLAEDRETADRRSNKDQ